jgi:hypothetical protein
MGLSEHSSAWPQVELGAALTLKPHTYTQSAHDNTQHGTANTTQANARALSEHKRRQQKDHREVVRETEKTPRARQGSTPRKKSSKAEEKGGASQNELTPVHATWAATTRKMSFATTQHRTIMRSVRVSPRPVRHPAHVSSHPALCSMPAFEIEPYRPPPRPFLHSLHEASGGMRSIVAVHPPHSSAVAAIAAARPAQETTSSTRLRTHHAARELPLP